MRQESIERILYKQYRFNLRYHKINNNILSYEEWLKVLFNKKVKPE